MQKSNDEQFVGQYLEGDEKSLEILIKQYLKPIYSFVYRYVGSAADAEDITQEVFVRMWRNIRKFDPQKSRFTTLQGGQQKKLAPYRTEGSGSGFKTWLFSIAKNASIDFLKKKKVLPFSSFSARGGPALGWENERGDNAVINTFADSAPLPDEIFEQKDIANMLNAAVEKLSAKYRQIIFSRYNNHFTFREIAKFLNEPLHTVKSRHRRALIILKKFLTQFF